MCVFDAISTICLVGKCLQIVAIISQVFEAVVAWTTHDIDNRRDLVSQLMEHVRLPLLSQDFLIQRVEEGKLKTFSYRELKRVS